VDPMTVTTTPLRQAAAFLAELAANNDRTWWSANKDRYQRDVREPFEAFTHALGEEFGPMTIRRPHRDVRFSADKSPYKTTIAGSITLQSGMLLGVQLSATELGAVAGHFAFAPDQLARYRAAVDDRFAAIVDALAAQDLPLESFSRLTRPPRGTPPDHPHGALLTYKALHVGHSWTLAKIPASSEPIADLFRTARPLLDWLAEHVGPTAKVR
jgi:uncharacterized protein (TIGR02453 family)